MAPKVSAAAKRQAARSRTPKGRAAKVGARTPVKTVKGAPAPAKAVRNWPKLYEDAATALRSCGVSGLLPCRDQERAQVAKHLRAAVRGGGSQKVLYVSGMPGTGKTASLLDALVKMREEVNGGKLPKFTQCMVNAMCLGSPAAAYHNILQQMPGAPKCKATEAPFQLKEFFANRKASDPVVVLLIDEVDQLVTANQAVLYRLFDLLEPSARLVVVAISNTVDLPERLLPRVTSRFEVVRVDYKAYSRDQINIILTERLRATGAEAAFEEVALKLCSARVASGSGDLRKAMQVCCRAVELRAAEGSIGPVGIQHTRRAEAELLTTNPMFKHVSGLGVAPRRFLVSIALELRKSESDVVSVRKVVRRYEKLCAVVEATESQDVIRSDAAFLIQKLKQLALLQESKNKEDGEVERYLIVGLDASDLSTALLEREQDSGIRTLLEESEPRAE